VRTLKKLLRPKVFIPVILAASVVAGLLAFADVRKVIALLLAFQWRYLISFLLLTAGYEVVRAVQWHFLLRSLGIHVPLRTQIFSFLTGEVAKTLPIGNYFPAYVLRQANGTNVGLTSAATTLIIFVEVAVSLVGLVILGIGGWGWLRPTILLGSLGAILLGWAVLKFYDDAEPARWMTERKVLRQALRGLHDFRAGTAELMRPRILAIELVFGTAYLVLAGLSLYMVLAGLGIHTVSVWQAMAVYFFSLAIGLIVPIPVDIGLIEISGIGALLAFGIDRSAAVSAMLLFRVLSIGASLLIALVSMALLRDELRATLRGRKGRQAAPSELAAEEPQPPEHKATGAA
jgi:uncharacterized protein (TIRG00374 family)